MATTSTLMSVREAARRLGVHDNTVRRYADRGLIRAVRLPSGVRRIRRDDVEALSADAEPAPSSVFRRAPMRTLDQLSADQGVTDNVSLESFYAPEIFPTERDLEEFLAMTYAERKRDLDR